MPLYCTSKIGAPYICRDSYEVVSNRLLHGSFRAQIEVPARHFERNLVVVSSASSLCADNILALVGITLL